MAAEIPIPASTVPTFSGNRCLREDPPWHFTAARPFTFEYPGQVEASDPHGRVPAVWPTLEEQVDQAFASPDYS